MGRPLRIERAGGWYHLTGRGNERKAIYRENRDRFRFIGLVAELVRQQLREHVKGNAREQRGAARLAAGRPELAEIIATVERIKGKSWLEFRDEHGDGGRDLVLYGRRGSGCAG